MEAGLAETYIVKGVEFDSDRLELKVDMNQPQNI